MYKKDFFLNTEQAKAAYFDLVLPRRIELKMLKLLRQNKIAKWFSGIGQEAICVGVARTLQQQDYVMSMHRNLGLFTTRKVPLYNLFCQLLGKKDGFSAGRERSFHFGIPEYKIIGMISHLGSMLPVGTGLALAKKLQKEDAVVLGFCGEGATSEGDFHEAMNLAAVWDLPMIFLVENNGYALSTPIREQFRCKALVDKAAGYGMKGIRIDGNNFAEVQQTIQEAREYALKEQKPVFIEAMTFRMRGHEEASGTAYVPDELIEEWSKKDPIDQFKNLLLEEEVLSQDQIDEIELNADDHFQPHLERALKSDPPEFDQQAELDRVWAPVNTSLTKPDKIRSNGSSKTEEGRYIEGVISALHQVFEEDEKTLIIGQDIAEYGGAFKVTKGFLEKYGHDRVRNTPIIESGAVGAAIGLALEGYRPIVEMQFADFISCAFNQIVNNLAKSRYRWSPPLNVTIRAPYGAGVGAGPFHSQSPESWFMQHPGLKIVVPSNVEDAKNLLYAALADPNPVMVFEHKVLYRSIKGNFPVKSVPEEIGKAAVRREGTDFSIITYGMGVHWALEKAEELSKTSKIETEVLDLRSLVPLDYDSIRKTTEKTGRVLLLQEHSEFMGPMSEISAWITENCFSSLDAPVMRCSSLDTPIPTNKILENGYLACNRLSEKLRQLIDY